jgi:hypothetical protein
LQDAAEPCRTRERKIFQGTPQPKLVSGSSEGKWQKHTVNMQHRDETKIGGGRRERRPDAARSLAWHATTVTRRLAMRLSRVALIDSILDLKTRITTNCRVYLRKPLLVSDRLRRKVVETDSSRVSLDIRKPATQKNLARY